MASRKTTLIINPELVKKIKQQRRTLGLIKFEDVSFSNYKKWRTFTENIVIRLFGEESNQLAQFRGLTQGLYSQTSYSRNFKEGEKEELVKRFKKTMKDLITNFIKELELDVPINSRSSNKTIIAPKFSQTINQTINISIEKTIENIIRDVREKEPDQERIEEAQKQLNNFKEEIKKESPTWAVVKNSLAWLLSFSRDAFLQVLPYLLEKYGK